MAPRPSAATLVVLRPHSALSHVARGLERALKRACDAPDDPDGAFESAVRHLLVGPSAGAGCVVGVVDGGDRMLPAHLLAPLLAPVIRARAELEATMAAQQRAIARIGSWEEKATGVAVLTGLVLVGATAAVIASAASSSSSQHRRPHHHHHHHHHHHRHGHGIISGGSRTVGHVSDAYAADSSDRLRRAEAERVLQRMQLRYARVTRLHDALQAAYAAALADAPPPPVASCPGDPFNDSDRVW
jgi:hypothetical protein